MHDELYPKVDRALTLARRFLTEKQRNDDLLAEFRDALAKLVVPERKREELVAHWCEAMNNNGRMGVEQAAAAGKKALAYAAGHAKRSRDFVADWLGAQQSATPEGRTRVNDLIRALNGALGG